MTNLKNDRKKSLCVLSDAFLSGKITKKYLLCSAVFLILLCSITAGTAFAEEEYPLTYHDLPDFSVPSLSHDEDDTLFSKDQRVSSYDLRTDNLVSPVKDQGDYGSCWSFAAINAIESNAIKKGYVTKDTADFSEVQLAYFFYNRDGVTSGTNPILSDLSGDYNAIIGTYNYLNNGGNVFLASLHLMTGIGVVLEKDAKYPTGSTPPTLSKNLAVSKNVYQVSDAYFVSIEDSSQIKDMIMEKGAGAISYYHNWNNISSDEKSYYQNQEFRTNHAVSVIGWDDTYPVSKFKSTSQPPGPGAWLIKNSWGTSFGDKGYFWISYYDTSLSDVVFFDAVPASKYTDGHLYQYDGSSGSSCITPEWTKSLTCANRFDISKDGMITDVSVYVLNSNVDCTVKVQIYNKTTGKYDTVSTASERILYTGYKTIPLSVPVSVQAGDKIQIEVTLTLNEKDYLTIGLDKSQKIGPTLKKWVECVSVSKPGQSYKYDSASGKMVDLSDLTGYQNTNLRIKAFVKEVFQITLAESEHGTCSANTSSARSGTEVTLTAEPDAGYIFDRWESDDVLITDNKFTMPGKDVTIRAVFTDKSPCKITVEKSQYGKCSASASSANPGTVITLTATADFGYTFNKWESSDVTIIGNSFTMPEKDVTVRAVFTANALPSGVTEEKHSISTANAANTTEVAYSVTNLASCNAIDVPTVTRGGKTIYLNETINVVAVKGGVETPVAAHMDPTTHKLVIDGSVAGADEVIVNFVGRKIGDVLNTGKVGMGSALRIAQKSAGMYKFTDEQNLYGDVIEDGKTGMGDALAIAQYAAGMRDDDFKIK